MLFTDRVDAGRRLAEAVRHLQEERPVVLGLPRGGVPVAFEVARALAAPLDVIVVRKLGVPYQPELGFGAIGEGGVRVLNEDIVRHAGVEPMQIAAVEHEEERELLRRARRYRDGRSRVAIEGRTVIVVDDGIATGATAAAACNVARAQGAARVVLAVPTAPPDAVHRLREAADEVVCLSTPHPFSAVGEWYRDFSQTSDEEVISLLAQAADVRLTGRANPVAAEVEVDADGVRLAGDLAVPDGAEAVVMFAHGSGSSRHSPRNRSVASVLREAGLGTLLFDLLTPAEETDRANVFDIDTLSRRLLGATRWLRERESLPIGYFGASTGAAAALRAAADAADDAAVGAVVSRGGRPDLAAPRLGDVRAPTLLIVGGHDSLVIDLNRAAQAELRCENRLEIVPRATHLFEEPGALDQVADLARDWFIGHLTADGDRSGSSGPGAQQQPHGRRALSPYATSYGRCRVSSMPMFDRKLTANATAGRHEEDSAMTKRMGRVTCELSISVDGYSAGLNQTEQRPFGDDGGDGWGGKLHAWMFDTPDENRAEVDQMAAAKAFIMGRNMFGPVRGEWDREWNGWWGENPPFHGPVFVLTHYPRDPQPMDGGTTFHFVTDGIESALTHAREAAGDGDVCIHGGATTINQYLAASLIEELRLHIVPFTLGAGTRLFDGVPSLNLEQVESRAASSVTHVTYRVLS